MATIDELMEGRLPGEIKIRWKHYAVDAWFRPYFKYPDGISRRFIWVGLNEENRHYELCADTTGWNIWQDPKKKRVMYQAIGTFMDQPFLSSELFETDFDFYLRYKNPNYKLIKLLTDRPIEVDD